MIPDPEPKIRDLLTTSSKAVRGACEKNADFVRGSDYESLLGPSAVIWSREAQRDTDLFSAVNFNTASGEDLTEMVMKRYQKERVLDTVGTGYVVLRRPTAATAETFWKGLRISIPGPQPQSYRVSAETPASSSSKSVTVPIEALVGGPGVAADVSNTGNNGSILIDDKVSDTTWYVDHLFCADGTTFESAESFKARIRSERKAARVGQSLAIVQACKGVGAGNVVLFRSDYAGDDFDRGFNFCYVGDLGYVGTPELVKACTLALFGVRVAGDHMSVRPMTKGTLDISADVYLNDAPARFDLTRLRRIHGASLVQYLNGTSGEYTYSRNGIRGALIRHTPEVQRVVISAPVTDGNIVFDSLKNFPATLTRYTTGNITLKYLGP